MGEVAEVVHHPGCSGVHDVGDHHEHRAAQASAVAGQSLWSAMVRGRGVSPLALVAVLVLGGGSGAGGSWLLGPGGWSDDTAVRADISAMRDDLGSMRKALESCEADIEDLDEGQVNLVEAVSDTQVKHAKAITLIAIKLGIVEAIDVSPPRQRARRVRR